MALPDSLRGEVEYARKGGHLLYNFWRARPVLCNWQITNRCNFRCDMCGFWCEQPKAADELSLDGLRTVAERLRPLAPLVISMAGGEPLMRRDLPEIAALLSKDHYFTLITNGWLVTKESAARLYDSGLKDIHVSLDYADPARHDAMRGRPGAFDRAVRAVEILRDARPDRRHRVHLMGVLLDDNIEDIEPLIELAERLGVSFELSLYSGRRGEKPDRAPRFPVAARLEMLKARHPKSFVSIGEYLANFDHAVEGRVPCCRAGSTFFNVNNRGEVSRCIDTNDQPVANLVTDSLEVALERLRAQSAEDPCRQCWTSCRGFAEFISGPVGLVRTLPDFYRAVAPL